MNSGTSGLDKLDLRDMEKRRQGSGEKVTALKAETMSCLSSLSSDKIVIEFKLHSELKWNLTQAQVNRISFYNVILQINKELAHMVDNNSKTVNLSCASSSLELAFALIDEEEWLHAAITLRCRNNEIAYTGLIPCADVSFGQDSKGSNSICTASERPTLLWKPNGSWWEARSKKNPKIGVKSHIKRWSYLWPVINYHKILARYIKKLKLALDNNVILLSLLKDESCAVSNHLAEASQFTAAQWIRKAAFFHGWVSTDANDEGHLRQAVSELHIKSLADDASFSNNIESHEGSLRDHIIDECISKVMLIAQELQKDFNAENNAEDESKNITKNSVHRRNCKRDKSRCNPQPLKPRVLCAPSPITSQDVSPLAPLNALSPSISPVKGSPLICNHIVSPITPVFYAFQLTFKE